MKDVFIYPMQTATWLMRAAAVAISVGSVVLAATGHWALSVFFAIFALGIVCLKRRLDLEKPVIQTSCDVITLTFPVAPRPTVSLKKCEIARFGSHENGEERFIEVYVVDSCRLDLQARVAGNEYWFREDHAAERPVFYICYDLTCSCATAARILNTWLSEPSDDRVPEDSPSSPQQVVPV